MWIKKTAEEVKIQPSNSVYKILTCFLHIINNIDSRLHLSRPIFIISAYASLRHTKYGSPFIKCLVDVFSEHACDKEMRPLADKVLPLLPNFLLHWINRIWHPISSTLFGLFLKSKQFQNKISDISDSNI